MVNVWVVSTLSQWLKVKCSPNLRSLSALLPASCKASCRVYGRSLFALSIGAKSRSRKLLRVFVAPMTRMDEIVTGRVELEDI